MVRELEGRIAVVTGGSRGIGRAVALAFAGAGAAGVAVVARTAGDVEAACGEVEALGCPALAVAADVAEREGAEMAIARAIERFGWVDVLVNNAGRSGPKVVVADMADDDWLGTMTANLHSAFYCSRAAIPGMVERRWGRIVNVASRAGVAGHTLGRAPGLPADAAYATAKAALIGFTRALAYELAPHGVTSNVVAPGPIATDMLLRQLNEEQKQARAALVPVGRLGTPEEVAAAVLYLAGPAAAFTTGELLNVNGGTWFS